MRFIPTIRCLVLLAALLICMASSLGWDTRAKAETIYGVLGSYPSRGRQLLYLNLQPRLAGIHQRRQQRKVTLSCWSVCRNTRDVGAGRSYSIRRRGPGQA